MDIISSEDEPLITVNGVVVDNSTTSTITEQDLASSKFLTQEQEADGQLTYCASG